jgi:hypothetical protein
MKAPTSLGDTTPPAALPITLASFSVDNAVLSGMIMTSVVDPGTSSDDWTCTPRLHGYFFPNIGSIAVLLFLCDHLIIVLHLPQGAAGKDAACTGSTVKSSLQ